MVPEYFNNSLYFESYGRFLEKKTHLVPRYNDRSKPKVQRPLKAFFGRLSRSKTQVYGPQFFFKQAKSIKYQVLPTKFEMKIYR